MGSRSVALLTTGAGPGGIAVIQVIGADAAKRVAAKFSRTLPRAGKLAVGRIVDEVVLRVGRSFGEPMVEVSCHGGAAPAEAVLRELGVERIELSSLLDRAVRAKRLDRLRAEAHLALQVTLTALGARVLQEQVDGALSKAVRGSLRGLLATASTGRALVDPPRVAIVGRANVGKSTLFNALVARERALVSAVAGTTRDPVEEVVAIRQVPVRLIDTAGLLPEGVGQGLLEQLSLGRTREEIERADLILLVRDATAPDSVDERAFGRWAESRTLLVGYNKVDLTQGFPSRRLGVSARSGEGLERLRGAVLKALGVRIPKRGAAVVFTERQATLLTVYEAGGREGEVRRRLLWG